MSFSDNTEPIWRNSHMVFSLGGKKLHRVLWKFLGISIKKTLNQKVKRIKFFSLMILCRMNPFYFDFKDSFLRHNQKSEKCHKTMYKAEWPPSQIISILLIALLSLIDIALLIFCSESYS